MTLLVLSTYRASSDPSYLPAVVFVALGIVLIVILIRRFSVEIDSLELRYRGPLSVSKSIPLSAIARVDRGIGIELAPKPFVRIVIESIPGSGFDRIEVNAAFLTAQTAEELLVLTDPSRRKPT